MMARLNSFPQAYGEYRVVTGLGNLCRQLMLSYCNDSFLRIKLVFVGRLHWSRFSKSSQFE